MVILGVLILVYIGWYLFSHETKISNRTAKRLAAPAGFAAGVLGGATGISAPVVGTYVHSLQLVRTAFVFAVALPFLLLGLMQIGWLAAFGGYSQERVVAGLVACVPVLIVTPIAMRLGKRLSVQTFQYVVLGMLGISAVKLLWDGLV
jgi:uncharacterized membrane protein YfcA